MNRTRRSVCAGTAFAVLVLVVACGKSSQNSPAAPSVSAAGAQPSPASSAGSGATIAGTIVSGVTALSLHQSSASAVTVSIVGTSITTIADGSGRFTLQNVPTGDLTLVFTGNGVNASLLVPGVNANDRLTITVRLNGPAANLDQNEHDAGDNAEIQGSVTSTNCDAMSSAIVVGTTPPATVNVQGARIRHDGNTLVCAQILVGDRVEVHGILTGAVILATDVNDKTEAAAGDNQGPGHGDGADHGGQGAGDGGHGGEIELKGTVSAAAAGHACPAFTFSVSGTTVATDMTTRFDDLSCAGVVTGLAVEVKGARTSATAILATRVERN